MVSPYPSRAAGFRESVLAFCLLLSTATVALSQNSKTVTGTVVDETDEPLIGATVQGLDGTGGTVTDFDGNFSVEVADTATRVRVSYIGYRASTFPITDGALSIVLRSDSELLSEVVVVGYGTVQKSDVVGSVESVDVDEATAIPTTNVAEMLRGRAPGVQVSQIDPRPGGNSSIVIRGKVSLVGNDPLVIVDGVPYDNINEVQPDDITSIEVLKDAAAQAIYGARAANGVILITTRRGQAGGFQVAYHGYASLQRLTRNFELFTPEEFAQVRREANRTDNNDEYLDDETIFNPFELETLQNQEYVNWEDLILRDARIQSHTLSLSGGSEASRVYSSLAFFDQAGLIEGAGFQRVAARVNVDQRVTDRISLQVNTNLQRQWQDVETSSLNFITISPLAKPFDEDGELILEPLGPGSTTVNPLVNIRESQNELRTTLLDLNIVGEVDLAEGLTYRLNTFARNRLSNQGFYRSTRHSEGNGDIRGLAELSDRTYRDYLLENIVTYEPRLPGRQALDLTFVNAVNQRESEFTSLTKSGFDSDALGYNGNATVLRETARDVTRRRLVSFLGRAQYRLRDRYLLTATLRADGSSVFAEDEKWGYFPAAAVAWKAHLEPFLTDVDAVTELKFRLSYGSTGNEGIDPSESLGIADDLPYVFDGVTAGGFAPLTRLPNPGLKWEATTTANLGLNYGLFENRVRGSFELYQANTTDFLLDRVLPGTSGFEVTRFNIGEVENRGVELALSYDVVRGEDLRWNVGATFSADRNEIVKLDGQLGEDGEPIDFVSQGLFVGEPIDNIRQRVFDGIFQEGDDIAGSAQPDAIPGDIRVVDINQDTMISELDLVTFRENPDFYGSVNTSLSFKGFELFADVYFVEGALRSNPYLSTFANGGTLQGLRNGIRVPYYTPENPSNEYPRPRTTTPSNLFALAVQDASYIRLRTVQLTYALPAALVSRLRLDNVSVYATGTNLVTLTDYLSWSPETNPGAFPDAKVFTAGLKVRL